MYQVGASKGAQEGKKNGQGKKPDAGKTPADKMAQMMAELREDAQDDGGEVCVEDVPVCLRKHIREHVFLYHGSHEEGS